jgi:ABC-type multidrug transport system ATPase subunit
MRSGVTSRFTSHSLASAGETTAAVVRTDGLAKTIDGRVVLRDINLEVRPGEFLAILGANGAGKSTLLRIIATLIPPTAGQLFLFGRAAEGDGVALRSRLGFIAHQSMLYRDLSAIENLIFAAKMYGVPSPKARALELLETVGLADRANDPAKAFSRGMTQRLAIARALVQEPELLLADEPFAGLDIKSMEALEGLLRSLHQAGRTVLLVSHDIPQSLRLAERIVVLRQGRIGMDRHAAGIDAPRLLAEVTLS